MKKAAICMILAFSTACIGPFSIRKHTPTNFSFAKYNNLCVGWLDLHDYNWKLFGFKNKDEWSKAINTVNKEGLQTYVKKFMPELKIRTAYSNTDFFPDRNGIYIKFTNIQVKPDASSLIINIHFIDIPTQQVIYTVSTQINEMVEGYKTTLDNNSFTGRLDVLMYSLAYFLYSRFYII